MIERLTKIWDTLRRVLIELDPTLAATAQQPALLELDENRTQFSWQGRPLVFDRRSRTISRAGRMLARYDAVRYISITEHKDGGEIVSWSVAIDLGFWRSLSIGDSDEGVDASIAAAHLAKATGKKVRVL